MTPEDGETCVRVVCNSCLNPLDVQTARAAKWGMHREWCASLPAEIGAPMKARRSNLGPTHRGEKAEPNNLLRFLMDIAPKTRSLFLATATPVQLDPIEAGRLTALQMLNNDTDSSEEEFDDDAQESLSSIYPLTDEERGALKRFLKILEENRDEDPKLRQVETILATGAAGMGGWLSLGCIIFSQYYDSVLWLGHHLSKRIPNEKIAVYAGATKSGIIEKGEFHRLNRDEIKKRITTGELRLVIGTDAT